MHHVEYIIARHVSVKSSFDEAASACEFAGYRLAEGEHVGKAVALDAWPWPEGRGARVRLPRGFALGDEVGRRMAHGLGTPVLRLFAAAGGDFGFDAFSPGGDVAFLFRSERPRRGDEGVALALFSGHGREAAQAIAQVLDPAHGASGPEALIALARAVGAPYPDAEAEPPSLRALFYREGES